MTSKKNLCTYEGGDEKILQKIFVYAATMVTIVALLGNNLSLGWAENPKDPETVDWWFMFRHDPRHSGYSTSRGPDTNNILWTYKTGLYVDSSPAVAYGRVYVGSDDGKMYCLDAETGEKLWRFSTPGWGLSSSPAVAYGRVYFGGTLTEALYCLDAETGEKLWSHTMPYGGHVSSSPVVVDDRVYIGGDKMYCLNATTGEEIWNSTKGGFSSPCVANDKVFFSSGHTMYCFSADTGEEIWSYCTGEDIFSSPAVSDGRVYFGSVDRHVYCLDAETGEKIWSFPAEFIVTSSPAIAYGKVYIGSAGKLYCLDAETGEETWSYIIGGGFHSSPAVADGKVYVGSNKMLCLDAYTGEEIWSYQADDDYFGYSSPAIANGRVYIGCYDWRLYCFADPLLNISKVSGGIGKVCVELVNPGDNPARNISWNVTIKGGVCGTINVTTMGSLASLELGETMVVSTNQTIFGFGLINIMVTAVAENTKPVYKEKKGLVFGPFVFTLPW